MDINIIYIAIFFGLLYAGSDAWHDNKVIEGNKKWHSIDAFIKLIVSLTIGGVVYYYSKDYLLSGVVISIIILIRASIFNVILNKLMGWHWNYSRGKGFDKIPIWVWWVLLVGLLVFSFTAYETNTPIKGTDIDFIEQSKSARVVPESDMMVEHQSVTFPEADKLIEISEFMEGVKIVWTESQSAEGVYLDKGTQITFQVHMIDGVLKQDRKQFKK